MSGNGISEEETIPVSHSRWPIAIQQLSNLGFERLSHSKNRIALRVSRSSGLFGAPSEWVELELSKKELKISLRSTKRAITPQHRLSACLLLSRLLVLLKTVRPDSQALCAFMLPSLEFADGIEGKPYESLLAENSEILEGSRLLRKRVIALEKECGTLSRKLSASEDALEQKSARLERLLAMPDQALHELLIDWISSHRGTFNAAHFHSAHGVTAARAEEGLRTLLEKGHIKKISGRMEATASPPSRNYGIAEGIPAWLAGAAKKAASGWKK